MGEFLGIDTDLGSYRYFRRHYSDWFPGVRQITRTTFVRQTVLERLEFDPAIGLVDSFPVPICRFVRAPRFDTVHGIVLIC